MPMLRTWAQKFMVNHTPNGFWGEKTHWLVQLPQDRPLHSGCGACVDKGQTKEGRIIQDGRGGEGEGRGGEGDSLFKELVIERQKSDEQAETELDTGLCPLHRHS